MSDLVNALRVKYGLANNPSDLKVKEWAVLVRQYIASGYDKELAGHLAAKKLFPDYQRYMFFSEAETIEALLKEAEKR